MQWQRHEPSYLASGHPVQVMEAERGTGRDEAMAAWVEQARRSGAATWFLRCRPESGGIWAGLAELIASLIPEIQAAAPALLAAHGYEIGLVLPRYGRQFDFSRSLTDTAVPEEQTRNYPADRAYRSLHGLIDLLGDWYERAPERSWAIACDDFDRANGLVRRFFAELARRRGEKLGLHLLLAAGPGQGCTVAAAFDSGIEGFRPSWPPEDPPRVDRVVMTQTALALEGDLARDPADLESRLPLVIAAWQGSTEPERALRWQLEAMRVFNHLGLYEASLDYAEAVAANLDGFRAEDEHLYVQALNSLFFCWVPLGQVERARQVVESALDSVAPALQPRILYLVAMLYARFLEPKDMGKAERYLEEALVLVADVDNVDIGEDDRQFLIVFLNNGLALIRVRQRRAQDAVDLCEAGLRRLDSHLDPTRHRLHRSVLLYNIAQVYAQIGPDEKAIHYFGETMKLDPNYSEYYNDRGSVYFKMGLFDQAAADYVEAIRLSPPYAEVWVNLGQCHRAAGLMADAVAAYSRALDLDPKAGLARVGRAEALFALGATGEARADYDAALALDPAQPLVLASRAIVHFEQGRPRQALADLDLAVAQAPTVAVLRQNRAVALLALGRADDAADELRAYLALCPDAPDHADVRRQLDSLLVTAAN